jgi:hypothetical protein
VADAAEPGTKAPFYSRWLSFVSSTDEPQAPAVQAVTVAAGATAKADDAPFYRRWLGLGGDEAEAMAPATGSIAPAATGEVPVPPSRPRVAAAPGKATIFTSLGGQ